VVVVVDGLRFSHKNRLLKFPASGNYSHLPACLIQPKAVNDHVHDHVNVDVNVVRLSTALLQVGEHPVTFRIFGVPTQHFL
jgi:hypothetical protein